MLRVTLAMSVLRFGDKPRVEAIAERLAGLPDDERLTCIATATDLADLERCPTRHPTRQSRG